MRARNRVPVLALLPALLGGCGIFGGKGDELPPSELLDFRETLAVRAIWSAKLGAGSENLRLALQPAGDGNRVYAASHDGRVSAFDPQSGRLIWRNELKVALSAGPGVGEGLVVVAGHDGDLIALRSEDGGIAWRRDIGGEALATPRVAERTVVIYTIDGRLRALSAFDGGERWVVEQSLPALTLRGSADPLIVGSTVIAGFDNGRLVAASLADGVTEWEAVISPPSGRSDLERLADIDGALAAVGQDVYAAGYQGRVASLAVESGQVLWAREISTHAGVAADWNHVYVAAADGELIALLRRNGAEVWRQDALLRRFPTAPVPFNTAVVAGDFEGYVHFFDATDGTPVARRRVGRGPISGAPVVAGTQLFVQSEAGLMSAFEVAAPPRPEPAGAAPADSG